MSNPERKPFWAKCADCNHCWPVAYLPMEMSKAGKLMRGLKCPMCAATGKRIVIAKQDDGWDALVGHWEEFEALAKADGANGTKTYELMRSILRPIEDAEIDFVRLGPGISISFG